MKINEVINETTTSGGIATSMGSGNGFALGGPGTITRMGQPKSKRKTKKKKS
jgi:hypothetical protein